MDDPHHRDVRKIGADWFPPKAMPGSTGARRRTRQDLGRPDGATSAPNSTSSTEIAVNFPLYVILSLLGLPESDFPACSS